MRVTSKGQVTIPIEMRRKYGIKPDMEVEFVDGERGPEIVVSEKARNQHADEVIARMRGAATTHLTTDEIMALWRGED